MNIRFSTDDHTRSAEDMSYPAPRVRTISGRECTDLLTTHHVGRVAWSSTTGPQMLPVSYAWSMGSIAFRTSPYGLLSQLIRPTQVVFEIDELDQRLRSGWSVVVHGRAEAVASPAELIQLWTVDGITPWANGIRNLFIAIQPELISGRAFDRDV